MPGSEKGQATWRSVSKIIFIILHNVSNQQFVSYSELWLTQFVLDNHLISIINDKTIAAESSVIDDALGNVSELVQSSEVLKVLDELDREIARDECTERLTST